MQIFLARNKVQAGPYSLDELNTMLASGEVVLDDLIWHEGMDNWQRLGDVTQNQYHYAPNANAISPLSSKPQVKAQETYHKLLQEAHVQYASIGSRFLAVVINVVLFWAVFTPFLIALAELNPDLQKLSERNFSTQMQYIQDLSTSIAESVYSQTSLLFLVYVIVQLILIFWRGQSLGKLICGIMVLDEKTLQRPKFTQGFLLRTLLLVSVYFVLSSINIVINLGLVTLLIHYVLASRDVKKQGWHDKLAKTVVVKYTKKQTSST